MAFVESSTKAFQKAGKLRQFCVLWQNSINVRGPLIWRRPCPYGQYCFHATPTPTTILAGKQSKNCPVEARQTIWKLIDLQKGTPNQMSMRCLKECFYLVVGEQEEEVGWGAFLPPLWSSAPRIPPVQYQGLCLFFPSTITRCLLLRIQILLCPLHPSKVLF